MTTPVEPLPGRRPVYPVDSESDTDLEKKKRERQEPQVDAKDDPAADAVTDTANHPNDE